MKRLFRPTGLEVTFFADCTAACSPLPAGIPFPDYRRRRLVFCSVEISAVREYWKTMTRMRVA